SFHVTGVQPCALPIWLKILFEHLCFWLRLWHNKLRINDIWRYRKLQFFNCFCHYLGNGLCSQLAKMRIITYTIRITRILSWIGVQEDFLCCSKPYFIIECNAKTAQINKLNIVLLGNLSRSIYILREAHIELLCNSIKVSASNRS